MVRVKKDISDYPAIKGLYQMSPFQLIADLTRRGISTEVGLSYLGARWIATRKHEDYRNFKEALLKSEHIVDAFSNNVDDLEAYLEQADRFDEAVKRGILQAANELSRKVKPVGRVRRMHL